MLPRLCKHLISGQIDKEEGEKEVISSQKVPREEERWDKEEESIEETREEERGKK
jgi:hypothetical protein